MMESLLSTLYYDYFAGIVRLVDFLQIDAEGKHALMALPSADPNAAFEKGLHLLRTGEQTQAADCFLAAFRTGPPDLRRRALAELEKLGKVETF